jgi:hypothetical protein
MMRDEKKVQNLKLGPENFLEIESVASCAEVKECVELYLHSPNTPSWRGAQLKHRDNFTFKSFFFVTTA